MGIQFKNVSHTYKGIQSKYDAIMDVNLNIDGKGEFIAIVGHTGSGKSTLVQHMNALLVPTSGTVEVFNTVLPQPKKAKINHLRQKVGLVFQFPEYQLFEETIIKDIMFGPKNFKDSEEDALKKAKTAANLVGIPESLHEQSPFRISGGQMRRVAVAGILAMEPKILVLDEPTRGLDPKGRNEFMDMFKKIHEEENKTIVLITHDMDIVSEYAKRIIVMKDGYVVFDGKKEELFEHPNFIDFYLDFPTPIKILKHLNQTLGIPYVPQYSERDLIKYLEAFYE